MVHFGLIDSSRNQVPLQRIEIRAKVHGYTAEVIATMTYNNKMKNPIEAVYILPLDEEAAVCGFKATIDGRTIVAEVQEKQEARDTYDDAISSGHSAFLLEESDESSDIFQINVGNLPAESTAKVELTFVCELTVEKEGRVCFLLPTVLNPRYTPQGGNSITASLPRVDSAYEFDFELLVQSASEIQEITSPHSKLNVVISSEDKCQATVRLAEPFKFDVDVKVMILNRDPFLPQATFENGVTGSNITQDFLEKPLVTLNFMPDFGKQEALETGEFIFVIDRSGSMSGDRIKNARETLFLFLKSLPEHCHFNVVGFGSSYEKLFSSSTKYSDSSVNKACNHAKNLEANLGGTEILEPLKYVFSQPVIKGSPRQVFLMTDGEVGNTQQVITLVKKNSTHARCFTFGIGQGASTALIKGVARAGQGTAEFITSSHQMQAKVVKTLRNALQPSMEDIKVTWDLPHGWDSQTIPKNLPQALFSGNRIIVYGLLSKQGGGRDEELQGKATLQATTRDNTSNMRTITHEVAFKLELKESDGCSMMHRVAAKRFIQEQQDAMGEDASSWSDDLKAKVINISKAANVVSKVTSFVAVDSESHVPIQKPMRESSEMYALKELFRSKKKSAKSKPQPKGPSPQLSRMRHSPMAAESMCYDPTIEDSFDDILAEEEKLCMPSAEGFIKKEKKKASSSLTLELIALQSASGTWTLSAELAAMLGVPVDNLQKACPDGVVFPLWATALALVWLHAKCAEKKDEWQMVGDK
ncbi:predicted protein, partial [Nematostella vectensis]